MRPARCRIAVIVFLDPFDSIPKPMILRAGLELTPYRQPQGQYTNSTRTRAHAMGAMAGKGRQLTPRRPAVSGPVPHAPLPNWPRSAACPRVSVVPSTCRRAGRIARSAAPVLGTVCR